MPLILPRRRVWLPGGIPRIDWSNPITRGLRFIALPGHGLTPLYSSIGMWPISDRAGYFGAAAGGGGLCGANGGVVGNVGGSSFKIPTPSGSCLAYLTPGADAADANWHVVFESLHDPSTQPEFSFEKYTDNNWYFGWNQTGSDTRASGAATFLKGRPFVGGGTWSASGTRLIESGTLLASNPSAPATFDTSASASNFIGRWPTFETTRSWNINLNSAIHWLGIWDRELTLEEARHLHFDPSCFLIFPEDDLFPSFVGSSGSTSRNITSSATLSALSLSSSLTVDETISSSGTLGQLTLSSSLTVTDNITSSATLGPLSLSSALSAIGDLSSSATLGPLALSSTVAVTALLSSSATLGALTLSSSITTSVDWTHVQGKVASNGTSASTIAVTPGASFTVGNHIIGSVSWQSSLGALTSITDDGGHTYTIVAGKNDATQNWSQVGFYSLNIATTATTVTAHFSAANAFQSLVVDEYSSGGITAYYDTGNTSEQTNPGTGANAVASPTITTANPYELVYGVAGSVLFSSVIYTAGAGFTLRSAFTGGKNPSSEDKVQTAAGSVAAKFTDNTATDTVMATVLAFYATGVLHLSSSATLGALTLSSALTVADKITSSGTLGPLSLSSSLTVEERVSSAGTLGALTLSSALTVDDKVSSAGTLGPLTLSATITATFAVPLRAYGYVIS